MDTPLDIELNAFLDLLDGRGASMEEVLAAQEAVRAYRDNASAAFVWAGLDKAAWCARIELLLADPRVLNQRPTGYCMPAACLFIFFKTIPEKIASFCIGLGREGRGQLGDLVITMSAELIAYDVPAYAKEHEAPINPVDYILMLAMQAQMSVTPIDAPDDYSAKPGLLVSNVTDLISATNLYVVRRKDDPKVADFDAMDAREEAALFADMDLFANQPIAGSQDHVVVLVPPLEANSTEVKLRFWSWGMYRGQQTPNILGGAYVKTLPKTEFHDQIDTAVFVKLKN